MLRSNLIWVKKSEAKLRSNLIRVKKMLKELQFKTDFEGEDDIKVRKAHISVDSRVITIIPERLRSFNAVLGFRSFSFDSLTLFNQLQSSAR